MAHAGAGNRSAEADGALGRFHCQGLSVGKDEGHGGNPRAARPASKFDHYTPAADFASPAGRYARWGAEWRCSAMTLEGRPTAAFALNKIAMELMVHNVLVGGPPYGARQRGKAAPRSAIPRVESRALQLIFMYCWGYR